MCRSIARDLASSLNQILTAWNITRYDSIGYEPPRERSSGFNASSTPYKEKSRDIGRLVDVLSRFNNKVDLWLTAIRGAEEQKYVLLTCFL